MILTILIAILGIFLTIFFVVGVHEFGHFIVARLLGVKVLRFSLGFGKALYRWHDKSGTEYVLAPIPLGGYVKMVDENEEEVPKQDLPFAYNRQPTYKKLAIVLAGPFFNFLFAFLIYCSLFLIGFYSIIPVIGKVTPNSIAANAGLSSEQEIVRVNNEPTLSWLSVIIHILSHAGDKDFMEITTKNMTTEKTQNFTLNLAQWKMNDLKPNPLESLGLTPYEPPLSMQTWPKKYLRHNQYDLKEALIHAKEELANLLYLNIFSIKKLLTGKISFASLGGPISIFQSAGSALNHGLISFVSFLAFLSIAVGFINILPVPGLDGGHILFQTIEVITRRPVSLRYQYFLYRLGFIFLFLLITQAIVNDILRLK